jgi:hypothetical protein
MKTKIKTVILGILLCFCPAKADVVWEEGYHQINSSDHYGEIWMYNDCKLDILGGDIARLAVYDTTITNWYNGKMIELWMNNNSVVHLFGGLLDRLDIGDDSILNLHAYDVLYHPTGGYWGGGWIEGRYLESNYHFDFDIRSESAISHINVVPEPATLLLLGFGGILLRTIKNKTM